MMKLVVEIECVGMSADAFDKETGSSDGLQPEQADLNCVHSGQADMSCVRALNELHLHEIRVFPSMHEADQFIWPTIEENGMTRPRKYSELSFTDAVQPDCDVKVLALNHFLCDFGLPSSPLILLKSRGVYYFLVPGDSGGGMKMLPSG
nr:hypothetical protein [Tanacetum cinerariifolium]